MMKQCLGALPSGTSSVVAAMYERPLGAHLLRRLSNTRIALHMYEVVHLLHEPGACEQQAPAL
jgi:hypothetical protein